MISAEPKSRLKTGKRPISWSARIRKRIVRNPTNANRLPIHCVSTRPMAVTPYTPSIVALKTLICPMRAPAIFRKASD